VDINGKWREYGACEDTCRTEWSCNRFKSQFGFLPRKGTKTIYEMKECKRSIEPTTEKG